AGSGRAPFAAHARPETGSAPAPDPTATTRARVRPSRSSSSRTARLANEPDPFRQPCRKDTLLQRLAEGIRQLLVRGRVRLAGHEQDPALPHLDHVREPCAGPVAAEEPVVHATYPFKSCRPILAPPPALSWGWRRRRRGCQ